MMKKNTDSNPKNDTQAKGKGSKKNQSALNAASKGGSATGNVRAASSSDVNGASGTRNTGTNVSYEDKE